MVIMWKIKPVSDLFPRKVLKVKSVFLLFKVVAHVREKGHIKENLLKYKGPGLNGLRNPQCIQITKDTTNKRFSAKRACPREKAECMTVQPFVNTLGRSKGQSTQSHKRLFEEIKSDSQLLSNQRDLRSLRHCP